MTINNKYLGITILVVLCVVLGYFYSNKNSNEKTETQITETASTTTENKTSTTTSSTTKQTATKGIVLTSGNTKNFYSYSNAEYNFIIKYPPDVKSSNVFSTFHEIGNNWRLYAGQANQGKPIMSFSIHNIDQGQYSTGKQTYPLFFSAEVRVGVSPNVKECYTKDDGYTNQKVTNVTINGTTFKRFSTSDAAMMKYVQAESYRTIHNNKCFVIEQIKNGSNYRDEKMTTGTTDTALNNYYNTGETIIKTFRFTK